MAKGGYQKQRIARKHLAERRARKRRARNKKILQVLIPLFVVALVGGLAFLAISGKDTGSTASGDCKEKPAPKTYGKAPAMSIDVEKTYTARFDTSLGTFTATLFADKAPKTVNNFVFLARDRFYDCQIFHRVIKGFMNQGGDPQGTGSGGPGYQFEDENVTQPFNEPGLLAMANSGPGTNGSQFFTTVDATGASHLNVGCPKDSGCHSIFGKVTDGLDVVKKINEVKTAPGDKPEVDVVINTITVAEA